jgi:hypothetical protein
MKHILNYIKNHPLVTAVIALGFLLHMAVIIPSGTYFCLEKNCGLFFFGSHGYDMIWHLALTRVAFNSIPFTVPVLAGIPLTGYNYVLDLVVFGISKVGIPSLLTFFKIIPVVWFALFTFSSIRLARTIHTSPLFCALLLFLFYFAGSFTYLLTMIHGHFIFGSANLLAMQSLATLSNIQYAFSLILLLETILLVKNGTLNLKISILLGVIAFITMGIKFYGGIIVIFLSGVFVLSNFWPFHRVKTSQLIVYGAVIITFSLLSIVIFYNPFSGAGSSVFTFQPWATIHGIIENKDLLYLPNLTNARYALQGSGLGPRLLVIELFSLLLFIFFNFGTRICGIVYILIQSLRRKSQKWEILILLTAVFAASLNVLFVQRGEWWNTVQFLYYALFITTIFTADFLYKVLQMKKIWSVVLVSVIIVLTMPINIDLISHFWERNSWTYIPKEELEALQFLQKQPSGVVYQPIFNKYIASEYVGISPITVSDNAYVPAFSGKGVLYTNQHQLDIMGVDYKKTLQKIQQADCSLTKQIQYGYILKTYKKDSFFKKCIEKNNTFKRAFANARVEIYAKVK